MFVIKNMCTKINSVVTITRITGANNVISYMYLPKFMHALEIFFFKLFIVLVNEIIVK